MSIILTRKRGTVARRDLAKLFHRNTVSGTEGGLQASARVDEDPGSGLFRRSCTNENPVPLVVFSSLSPFIRTSGSSSGRLKFNFCKGGRDTVQAGYTWVIMRRAVAGSPLATVLLYTGDA
jgi:hypothetical protein